MSPVEPAVALRGIHKAFAGRTAVRDLTFEVPTASISGFLGPNGAGKTTTLRMILGMLSPDAGEIRVLGQADPSELRERLAYLPEEKGLYRRMGVLEFLVFFARLRGLHPQDARARASRWLDRLALADVAQARCESLSKGMGQKLQIATALVHDPELIILDEPFSGLDPVNVELVREVILEARRAGRTVILSTHVMEQAETLCDHVVLLDAGARILAGSMAEVRASAERTLRVDHSGECPFPTDLPGVLRVNDAGVHAELSLAADADPDRILAALVGRVRIRRFELAEQSLHEVFVRNVGTLGRGDATEGAPA